MESDKSITEERLLDAIILASEVIVKHGIKFAPILDRLERDLAELRERGDPLAREKAYLRASKKGNSEFPRGFGR